MRKPRNQTAPASIDRYHLLRVLGRGGMGIVYLAYDTLLDREVALKVVDRSMVTASGDRLAGLFQQEARNLAGLNHPGIVQIFDYSGLYSNRLYLVMEYVAGKNLGDLAPAGTPLDETLVTHIGRAVSGVLAYAHAHGIIHQDLKPENILLSVDGRLKLTDFGISRRLFDQDQRSGRFEVVGTPAYMAPEQSMGRQVDQRVDVFSLGATLYTLATGSCLVEGVSTHETVASIARGDFPSLATRRPDLSSGLAAVVDRALLVDPDQRYRTATAMAEAFSALLGQPAPEPEDVPRVPRELLPRERAPRTDEHARPLMPGRTPTADTGPTALADTGALPAAQTLDPADVDRTNATIPHDALEQRLRSTVPRNRAREASRQPHALLGRFELARKLGTGAFGEKWLAHDRLGDGAAVALKIFEPSQGASIDEFKAEFRDLARLKHPNLVAIHDFGLLPNEHANVDAPPRAFYTLDYIEGPSIRGAIEGKGVEDIYELLVQVARGLVFLHTHTQRPHLSLKPENIIVTTGEAGAARVVITDPGNPTEKLRSIQRGERTCLPYAAPETLAGLVAGPSADLYSLGVIAFELLTGRRPFTARTSETLRAAHQHEPPPDLGKLRPEIHRAVADAVLALLAKRPSDRPSGADALIRAINTVVVPPYPIETADTRFGRFSSAQWAGRPEHLDALIAGYRAAIEPGSRAARVWLIEGPAGVGKQRLLGELKRTAQLDGVFVIEGIPAAPTQRPLAPLFPWLAARKNSAIGSSLSRRDQLLCERVLAGTVDESAEPVAPVEVARLLVQGVTRPSVVILTNVHLLDRATLEVVNRVSRVLSPLDELDESDTPPLLLVLSLRRSSLQTADAEALEAMPQTRWLRLTGMDVDGTAAMLRAVFGEQPLPPDKLQALQRVTDGNPGHIQDVLYTLMERGDLSNTGDGWRLRAGVDVPLPASVEAALNERLAVLGPQARSVLEALCVFANPVPALFIDGLESRETGAATAVRGLIERELLTRCFMGPEVCLTFGNEGIREATLRSLSATNRERRHREAAEWLEAQQGGDDDTAALAHHWNLGGRPDVALTYLTDAADQCRVAGDTRRAVVWYEAALETLPKAGLGVIRRLRHEATLREHLGATSRAAGDLVAAETHFARLLAIGEDLENETVCATAIDRLALVMIDARRFEDALAYAERGHQAAVERESRRDQAMALRLIGSIKRDRDGAGAGLADLKRALEVAGDDPELGEVRARIAVTLSYSYTSSAAPNKGIDWAAWGLEVARNEGLVEMEVSLLINLSMAAYYAGRFERALEASREAMLLSQRRGLQRYATLAVGNVGDCLRACGRFEEAEGLLRQALKDTYAEADNDRVIARLVELASLCLDQRLPKRALPYLREAWRLLPTVKSPTQAHAVALLELRSRLWNDGDVTASAETTDTLIQLVSKLDALSPTMALRASALCATAAWASHHASAAEDHVSRALAVVPDLSGAEIVHHTETLNALAATLVAMNRWNEADDLQRMTTAALKRCAAAFESDKLRRSFEAIPAHADRLADA